MGGRLEEEAEKTQANWSLAHFSCASQPTILGITSTMREAMQPAPEIRFEDVVVPKHPRSLRTMGQEPRLPSEHALGGSQR